ncbi:MAG: 2,3-bisphosphoglycerate-independent phosphoglycerate mutase [Candidatus Pacebacteria bacterium]|nr:2,3-bisphosphoglycerate-independent phosphoglycerate mutase [Candidatus Paceibacterota bacterium]
MEKIILIVLDGWGVAPPGPGNPMSQINLLEINRIENNFPATTLAASGIAVGLPWWEEGNSEVGHLTMGAGRIIYHYLVKILNAIRDGSFFKNKTLLEAIDNVKNKNSKMHLVGLVGPASIHSYLEHLEALFKMCKDNGLNQDKVFLHVFTDGKDSGQMEGKKTLQDLLKKMKENKWGQISTIAGRIFGLDRGNRWNRIKKGYNLLTKGEGEKIKDPIEYLENNYKKEIYDSRIPPAVLIDEQNNEIGLIEENDSVIFFDFREDSERELTRAFIDDNFTEFEREKIPNLFFVGMTKYIDKPNFKFAFEKDKVKNSFGEIISNLGYNQLRLAETEKFAHVTSFFNALKQTPLEGEDRIVVPPSTWGKHYEVKPEMGAFEIKDTLIEMAKKDVYQFILVNFANPDIIGHSGNFEAAKKTCKIIDNCIGEIVKELINRYTIIITADHGNVEQMFDTVTGRATPGHTINPVPFYLIKKEFQGRGKNKTPLNQRENTGGSLADIAPTMCEIMQIPKPKEMTGLSLLPDLIE